MVSSDLEEEEEEEEESKVLDLLLVYIISKSVSRVRIFTHFQFIKLFYVEVL